jgi:hypothetical protein
VTTYQWCCFGIEWVRVIMGECSSNFAGIGMQVMITELNGTIPVLK